jgi:hypothetical protein
MKHTTTLAYSWTLAASHIIPSTRNSQTKHWENYVALSWRHLGVVSRVSQVAMVCRSLRILITGIVVGAPFFFFISVGLRQQGHLKRSKAFISALQGAMQARARACDVLLVGQRTGADKAE